MATLKTYRISQLQQKKIYASHKNIKDIASSLYGKVAKKKVIS